MRCFDYLGCDLDSFPRFLKGDLVTAVTCRIALLDQVWLHSLGQEARPQ
jgi:hypothetical protein